MRRVKEGLRKCDGFEGLDKGLKETKPRLEL